MRLEVLALYQPIVCLVISCCLTEAFIIAVDLDFVYRYVKCDSIPTRIRLLPMHQRIVPVLPMKWVTCVCDRTGWEDIRHASATIS